MQETNHFQTINKYLQGPTSVGEKATHSLGHLGNRVATVGWWRGRHVTVHCREAQAWLEWVLTSVKDHNASSLQPPPPYLYPCLSAVPQRRCFRTWASRFLDTFLSLSAAPSLGACLGVFSSSGSPRLRGQGKGAGSSGRWRLVRKRRWEHHVSGGPTYPPDARWVWDWQRSSHSSPSSSLSSRKLGGARREPSIPE